ncbi:DUF4342 domain-containing protein [Nodosilinea sp. LEGE 07088]|uniref:DUF4342 domain-containing protein n=1 Tax=Nodosilinea sp. LEGE 07088 TaxID=2777968 RepID=UPI00187FA850|nr:DUF4342 domain-containing protein [Nodosilinea sp. LEGE 07088]MBE9137075.1 DUF4342 domain-containing protein [Nodosilinea sp. LEGE 07088]
MAVHAEETTQTVDITAPESITPETEDGTEEPVTVEEFKISGDTLVANIKGLIRQGNIRRIIIQNETGHTLIEIPLTVGVIGGAVGAAFFPVVAALGVIGAMVAHLTVVVERQASSETDDADVT